MSWGINNIKIKNNEFENVWSKNSLCYYFVDVIKIKDFDFGSALLDEKSY